MCSYLNIYIQAWYFKSFGSKYNFNLHLLVKAPESAEYFV